VPQEGRFVRRKKHNKLAPASYRQTLTKQGYHAIGHGGAVKPCLWLKKSLRNEGVCYKEQFYGIQAHRCIQMTPTLHCNQQCLHCWRATDLDATEMLPFDEPKTLAEDSIAAQRRLISGYKGSSITDERKLEEAYNPSQVAISLSGEPTLYPYLDELIKCYHEERMTTFVVSNGSRPEVLEEIRPTQLYVSLNSPDEEHFYAVCRPRARRFEDLLESLRVLADHPSRTAIRITLADKINAFGESGYAKLIELGEPDYIEVKSYMHLGFSRKRLPRTAMMSYERVESFATDVADRVGYVVAEGSPISRVVVLSRSGSIATIAG
jgi:tRNA wybutosine-synthesizing protein 1